MIEIKRTSLPLAFNTPRNLFAGIHRAMVHLVVDLCGALRLTSCSLYVLNRWLVKPHLPAMFFHSWFNDALLIPSALPSLLLLHRWLGLRSHDGAPSVWEIATHVAGWSVLFEVIGPHLVRRATGDVWDVLAYALGAAAGWLWWRRDWLLKDPEVAREL